MKKLFLFFALFLCIAFLSFAGSAKLTGWTNATFDGGKEGYWLNITYTLPNGTNVSNPYPVITESFLGRNATQAVYFIKENVYEQYNEYLKNLYPNVTLQRKQAVEDWLTSKVNTTISLPNEIYYWQDVNFDGRDDKIVLDLNGNFSKVIIREKDNNYNITTGVIK